MIYDELETELLAEFRKTFTEYYPGRSTPDGYVEPAWDVQADAQELHDWIRSALRKVKEQQAAQIEALGKRVGELE